MAAAFYAVTLALSLALALLYVFIWHKHFDAHITLIFALVPIVNLGYAMLARAQSLEAALMARRITYLGGCYLLLFITLAVFSQCDIRLNRWLRAAMTVFNSIVYLSALSIGHTRLFYAEVRFEQVDGAYQLLRQYGPMHAVFRWMIGAYCLMSLAALAYGFRRKNQVSRKALYLMLLPEILCVLSYFGGRQLVRQVELIPAAYTVALATFLIIAYRISLYDVTDTAIDSLVESGDTGFASFDFRLNYLGSNETARAVFPALNGLTVDGPIHRDEWMRAHALKWLDAFRKDEAQNTACCEQNGRTYLIRVSYLFDGRRNRGYQLFITDDTRNQEYIRLINTYNTQLQLEVAEKTEHIVEMHDKLILGMATMVESRDNSTGGHIRRTSEGVRMLVEELRKEAGRDLSEAFCKDLIKAAPMHDLGKIAVDDVILRKPGRFTPEEFDKMKAHAAEGARIVRAILEGTEDEAFRRIAENVAHYHHERWDGSGYPEGLKGEAIPLEARIMAIADVYDALVSKRVYKDSMSFEQADAIILDGMGRHFDRGLEACYIAARPRLEAYYAELGQG